MAITTADGYIAATKQRIPWTKTAARTTVALQPYHALDVAGSPGAGTLAGTNTASGVIQTDALAGYPILTFSTGTGYLSGVEFGNTVTGRFSIYDVLWKGGTYNTVAVTGMTTASWLSRTPDGAGGGLEIWVEGVTAYTGNLSVAVVYTNQAGTGSRTTGTVSTGVTMPTGRLFQLPLQAGDTGIQSIQSITPSVGTGGTCNVLVMRPLVTGLRVSVAGGGGKLNMFDTGMPIVYSDSALTVVHYADSTAIGVPYINFEIANG